MEATMETGAPERAAPEKIGLTVKEAAGLLGIGQDAVYALARRADFPALRVGRKVIINRRLLGEWLDEQCREAGACIEIEA